MAKMICDWPETPIFAKFSPGIKTPLSRVPLCLRTIAALGLSAQVRQPEVITKRRRGRDGCVGILIGVGKAASQTDWSLGDVTFVWTRCHRMSHVGEFLVPLRISTHSVSLLCVGAEGGVQRKVYFLIRHPEQLSFFQMEGKCSFTSHRKWLVNPFRGYKKLKTATASAVIASDMKKRKIKFLLLHYLQNKISTFLSF